MNFKTFKTIIYNISNQSDFKVIELIEPNITPNFYIARVKKYDNEFFILASYEDNWAFTKKYNSSNLLFDFINNSKLSKLLKSQYRISVLTKEKLNSLATPPLGGWGAKENDIKYWKPKTLGEVLFNYWD